MKKYLLAGLLFAVANFSFSEDIELYISESVKEAKARPQVLIVFDNSGSMNRNETVKTSYSPNTNYDAVPGYAKAGANYIYYTKGQVEISGIPIADDTTEKRKFLLDISNCKAAQNIIEKYGFYTGHVREYKFQGNSGRWTELNEKDGSNIVITDCEDDVVAKNNNNKNYLDDGVTATLPSGYPIDGEGEADAPVFYTNDVSNSNVEWSGALVTLYSDNYLRWYHNPDIPTVSKDRIEIAQESVTNLINSSPNVDFGLQIFNHNHSGENVRDGGRIVFGIKESNLVNREAILDLINNNLDAETNTPLCETLYEASLYFGGKSVDFGDNDSNRRWYLANTPPRDTNIETAGKVYISPLSSCSDKAYVIIMTDGEPTRDLAADNKVKALGVADNYPMAAFDGNYLAALAGWMNNNDVNKDVDGKQTITTYTIGFGQDAQDDAEPLLKEAAKLGGGKYFPAKDTASLTAALTNVLANLEPSNDSLTSASVAANNFDRTETLNSVYYAMFQPDRGPRWQGNLKKYKVIDGVQQGKNGNAAIDGNSGHFSTEVTSYWSGEKDGDQVTKGGVADMLRKKSDRVIYSDIDDNGGLALLNEDALTGNEQAFADLVGIDVDDALTYFNWNLGIDVDDEDEDSARDDMRYGVFGDPLHSKPLVVNYGDKIHLVIGTNAGALHMFKDSEETVDETWAFMPKEFFPNIKKLRENYSTDDKIYGIDGKITSYISDKDGDGIIEEGDKVWIFFGLRRGGTSYYGLDISNPDSPSLLWHIDASMDDFKEMGQSWSQPKVGYSKINIAGDVAKPVLFFGGGYDTSKDNSGVGAPDNVGRAVYMVDAETGTLKWSMAPESGTTSFAGTDSIPASISTLDSDADGFADRLYLGDTGGNVWRVDMPSDNPIGEEPWSVFKLASLGGNTNPTDRRFFNEASVVRTFISQTIEEQITDDEGNTSNIIIHQDIPYDAVLLGSGDRSNPLGKDTNDMFFMIKDKHIKTQTFDANSVPPIPSPVVLGGLFDITANPIENANDEDDLQKKKIDLSAASGWYFSLKQEGEKNTSSGIVINNTVYFTTFTPPSLDNNHEGCELPNGQGSLYGVDLAQGISKFNWKTDGDNDDKDREDRITFISEQFLGSPTLIVIPPNPNNAQSQAVGNLIVGRRMVQVGFRLQTMRTYLYVTE